MPHSECPTIKATNEPHNDSIYLNTAYHHIRYDQFTSQYLLFAGRFQNCSQSRGIKYNLALEIAHANSCRMQAHTFFPLFITNLVTSLQASFNSAMIDNLEEYYIEVHIEGHIQGQPALDYQARNELRN